MMVIDDGDDHDDGDDDFTQGNIQSEKITTLTVDEEEGVVSNLLNNTPELR